MFRLPDDPAKLSLWTRSMLAASVGAMVLLTMSFVRIHTASSQPTLNAEPERINPNTASMASLVRLPGIGQARAIDIIQYRGTNADQETAFRQLSDMENISGIGPKTTEAMAEYLTFETAGKTE